MAFDTLALTPGTGFNLAVDSFTDTDSTVRGMPYGAVAYGPIDGPYVGVTTNTGLPVQPQAGATFPVSLAGVALDATLTDGTLVAKPKTLVLTGTCLNLNDVAVASTDVSDYRSGSFQYAAAGSVGNSYPNLQFSNDGVNWFAGYYYSVLTNSYRSNYNQQANDLYVFPVLGRYLRVVASGNLTFLATVTVVLSSSPPPPPPAVNLQVTNGSLTQNLAVSAAADGMNTGLVSWIQTLGVPVLFNGSNGDRQRNNHEVTALASAARTASVNSSDLVNYNARGVNVVLDITAGGGAGSLTVKITGKDTLSGKYVTLFNSGAVAAPGVSTHLVTVYPGVATSAYAAGVGKADFPLPRVWRVEITAADATSYTYGVGVNYIL